MTDNELLKVISLDRRATIDRAETLRETLLEAISSAPSTLVNLAHVEVIDLTAIHLLYAAKRQALAEKKRFEFTGTVPPWCGMRSSTVGSASGRTKRVRPSRQRSSTLIGRR